MTIIPETLKSYREKKNLSQAELARESGVSKKTISRIELGEISSPNRATRDRLAKALEVKVEDLAKDAADRAEIERFLKQLGYRSVSFHMDAETANAFNMIQHRYGVTPHALIKSAPLLMAILAECSLQWRKQKAAEIEAAVSALGSIASDAAHMAYAHAGYRADEALGDELRSIEAADIFGKDIGEEPYYFGYDDSKHNPFADYLRFLCKEIDPTIIKLDPDGLGNWKVYDCIPNYRIVPDEVEHLTCGDTWAQYAIERGHVKISDIPKELIGDGHDEERVAWITAKIPEEARREYLELLDSLPDIKLD